MEIANSTHGAVTVLKPSAALAGQDAAAFTDRFSSALGRSLGRVVVDCSLISHVDSDGLEALVAAAERLAASGNALKMFAVNETLREVLDLTETASLFEFYADAASAVRSYL